MEARSRLALLLISVALATGYHSFARTVFLEERSLDFAIRPGALASGGIQLSMVWTEPSRLSGMRFADADFGGLAELHDTRLLLVKAAFLTRQRIETINAPAFFSFENLPTLFPGMRFSRSGTPPIWLAATPLPSMPGIPEDMRCELELGHLSGDDPAQRQRIVESGFGLDPELGHPQGQTTQSCANYNVLFRETEALVRYFKLGEKETLVVSYQVLAVNRTAFEKASWVPFFDLEKKVESQLREELRKFTQGLLQVRRAS
ncbi:MAG: hypothetical protein NDJ89_09440 [Oligoflexia bacterium]|nr:hypothetical protein [Oligoflexia bacterium]